MGIEESHYITGESHCITVFTYQDPRVSPLTVYSNPQDSLNGHYYVAVCRLHISLYLRDLGVHQITVPEALQKVKGKAGSTIEKTQLDHVAIEEIDQRAGATG